MNDDLLEARLADALHAARTDPRLAVSPWIDGPARISRASRRRRVHHASVAVTALSALVLGTIGVGKAYLDHSLHAVQTTTLPTLPGTPTVPGPGHLQPKPAAGQPFTVLILGTDSRSGTGSEYGSNASACGCSDTIMLARVNPQTSKVSLLSVPRDTRVANANTGKVGKLNAAFGNGPDNTVATIEKSLNIPINHWVVLDLAGFKSIVDAVGGVRMDIPVPIKDKNAGLDLETTGCQTLTGDQALAISRARELTYLAADGKWTFDPAYEYGRQRREQTMMRVIAAHTAKASLSNPITAAEVVSTFTSHNRLAVDSQITSDELVDLAGDFAGYDASAMQTFSLPTYTQLIDRQDFEILEQDKDVATIQAWYDAVQPVAKASAVPTTTTPTSAAPTTTPATTAATDAGATALASAATPTTVTAVAPNQPEPWDPQPCS